MFDNKDCALSVRESMLNAALLLKRSVDKVLDGQASENERDAYCEQIDLILGLINNGILMEIYKKFPDLKTEL